MESPVVFWKKLVLTSRGLQGGQLTVGTSAAQVPIFRSQSDQRHETPRPKHFCLGLRQLNYRIYRQFEPSTVRLGILSGLHHASSMCNLNSLWTIYDYACVYI